MNAPLASPDRIFRRNIWPDKISWYREAFQKVIDGAHPGKNWQEAYKIFAKAWNQTTQWDTLPVKTSGMDSVFGIYNIRPRTLEALQTKLGGITLKIVPPESVTWPEEPLSVWSTKGENDDTEGEGVEDDDAIPDLKQNVLWIHRTGVVTMTTEAILSAPKSEEELRIYAEFEEFFLEQFGTDGNRYLPTIDEVWINVKKKSITITNSYRERVRVYFKNDDLRERILDAIFSFHWK